MTPSQLTISSRFNGPPNSGNGGYSAGIIGQYIDGPSEVILRSPPPLDTTMNIVQADDALQLMHSDQLIAIAKSIDFQCSLPDPVSFDQASAFSKKYIGFNNHHFSSCFVCGPDRGVCDGLRLFSGATNQENIVAAPWIPCDDLFDENGHLETPYYWAAMDCPSYFAIVGQQLKVLLLGKMATRIVNPIVKGERIVVMGWKEQIDGRKHHAGAVLYGEDGSLKSYAKHIWIALKKEQIEQIAKK